jgi:cell wall-associated NlpC family hydrolase
LRAASFADAAAPAALVQFVPTPTTDASSGRPAVDVGPVAPRDGSAGARIIAGARKYLGVPYVSDGATPDGFDCSGYTMWVYSHAGVAQLPHFADSQRQLMHEIPESAARPGDPIFYLDGDYAYHVAIHAGYGMQYARPPRGRTSSSRRSGRRTSRSEPTGTERSARMINSRLACDISR